MLYLKLCETFCSWNDQSTDKMTKIALTAYIKKCLFEHKFLVGLPLILSVQARMANGFLPHVL